MDVLEGLQQIRGEMDRYVVGHDDVKEAVMLGLIAQEHIYLEGPPGTAKTMLAEITSEAGDLKFFFYQLIDGHIRRHKNPPLNRHDHRHPHQARVLQRASGSSQSGPFYHPDAYS